MEGLILLPGDTVHRRENPNAPAPQAGEIYDRYRHKTGPRKGMQYTNLSLNLLGMTAEIGRHLGLDLWGTTAPGGENLRLPQRVLLRLLPPRHHRHQRRLLLRQENDRLGQAGESVATFELGFSQFPDSAPLQDLLWVMDRPLHVDHLLGPTVLTHGVVFPEQAGLAARAHSRDAPGKSRRRIRRGPQDHQAPSHASSSTPPDSMP